MTSYYLKVLRDGAWTYYLSFKLNSEDIRLLDNDTKTRYSLPVDEDFYEITSPLVIDRKYTNPSSNKFKLILKNYDGKNIQNSKVYIFNSETGKEFDSYTFNTDKLKLEKKSYLEMGKNFFGLKDQKRAIGAPGLFGGKRTRRSRKTQSKKSRRNKKSKRTRR